MKKSISIICILIIFFKTGNVLSENNIFYVNNIEINTNSLKSRKSQINQAFRKGFDELTDRLLLKKDYKNLSNLNLDSIKKLISYYQIISPETKEDKIIKFNISFDKGRMHDLFYKRNIFYSDAINSEVVFFPLLKTEGKYFIYNNNYFYEKWNDEKFKDLTSYTLPVESIESIEKINFNLNNIYNLEVSDFFNEFEKSNIIFANIEIFKDKAEVFLKSRIEENKINKRLIIKRKENENEEKFFDNIIYKTKKNINDLIKSQNLIDVRTPSFLNVILKLDKKKSNLVEFDRRLEEIELIDSYYVQKINKDYVNIKIKYLGKINKIINKLSNQNINLKMVNGEWSLRIIQ